MLALGKQQGERRSDSVSVENRLQVPSTTNFDAMYLQVAPCTQLLPTTLEDQNMLILTENR